MGKVILASALCLVAASGETAGPTVEPASSDYRIPETATPIRVDAVLDDAAWKSALEVELPFETWPGDNVRAPAATRAWLTYDRRRLYVAFRANDPNPSAIRAHYTDRDSAFQDDFVGVVLDTFNDERRALEFFVNPLGVQMDLTNDDVAGNEDSSWDTLWESSGRLEPDGFTVEIAIPFDSLRFAGHTAEQTWGIDILRVYPRDQRRQMRITARNRNRNCYLCQLPKFTGLAGISPGRNLELAPTLTAHGHQDRPHLTAPFDDSHTEAQLGLSVRWGVTPNVLVNAALNPDFSQVEADAAQLDVNNRFALLFNEKRPFFLDSADLFDTTLQAVFSRTIAAPDWGLKLTGKTGGNAFGVLAAKDSVLNVLVPGPFGSQQDSFDGAPVTTVLRYRRDVGASSTIGALYTDRRDGDYRNQVYGADATVRVTGRDIIRAQWLGTTTRYPEAIAQAFSQPAQSFSDDGRRVAYNHSSRNWFWYGQYQDLGPGFRADTGFVTQVDSRLFLGGIEHSFWGPEGAWWSRFNTGFEWDRTTDHSGRRLDRELEAWVFAQGPMQSEVNLNTRARERLFEGTTYHQNEHTLYAQVRPSGSVRASLNLGFGDDIDYQHNRAGTFVKFSPSLTLGLGRHLKLDADHTLRRLDITEGRLFTANLSQLRAVYQFNNRAFARAILQYTKVDRESALYSDPVDRRSEHLFSQFLLSYKVSPQTVAFLGYSDNAMGDDAIELTRKDRTIFFKLGYAWRP